MISKITTFLITLLILLITLILIKQILRNLLIKYIKSSWISDKNSSTLPAEVKILSEILNSYGFEFIGIKSEKFPFIFKENIEWNFSSSENICFASIVKFNEKHLFYFYTPFKTGEILITANGIFTEIKTQKFFTSNVISQSINEVLIFHKRKINELISNSSIPYEKFDRKLRLDATNLFYSAKEYRNYLRRTNLYLMVTIFLLIFSAVILNKNLL
ncbi:hypothetical protein [Leptospira terpstrae]|uniref:Uncharacterized protein n=1 Tax=Leptospira terpstrae serovar Hualin str. LT 11-33 = ATCC 700639 TaxID=1257025 RepID=N1VSV5_9LEPT|nr:hypothetical protein [Leptospira terpstrae]EMY60105.1 hypothetical protein LEP1GSC203_1083 [Leptospira terpstrae serovar Hualin str. LT 11-33 = ATCC 700639]